MTQWHLKSRKKSSGGFRNSLNRMDKKLSQRGGDFASTKVEQKDERKIVTGRGQTIKGKLKKAHFASLTTKAGKTQKAQILRVVENSADRHFGRRDIITKGGIIEVELAGKKLNAMVTSRPGQSGTISAVVYEGEIASVEKKAEKKPPKEQKIEEVEK